MILDWVCVVIVIAIDWFELFGEEDFYFSGFFVHEDF